MCRENTYISNLGIFSAWVLGRPWDPKRKSPGIGGAYKAIPHVVTVGYVAGVVRPDSVSVAPELKA